MCAYRLKDIANGACSPVGVEEGEVDAPDLVEAQLHQLAIHDGAVCVCIECREGSEDGGGEGLACRGV